MTPEKIKEAFNKLGIDIQQKENGHFAMTKEVLQKMMELKSKM